MKYVVPFILIVSCCFSCEDESKDNSLSVDEYMEMGIPDPYETWTMADYTQAHNVLAKIKWERPLNLPTKDSEKSGDLFRHMVGLEFLSFLQDSTMSLNEKAERISGFTKIYDYWMDVYTSPIVKKGYYQREILELQIFNLRVMEAMVNLAQKINESDDPADVALQYGYQSIVNNYVSSLANGLKTQRNTPEFLEQDLKRSADSIYASVMRNREWMDSSAVRAVQQSLKIAIDSVSSTYIRNKYQILEKSLAVASQSESKYLKK